MSKYEDIVKKVEQYSLDSFKNCQEILGVPDDPIRKDARTSRYFAGPLGSSLKLPPTFLYYRSLLSATAFTPTEKNHLIELVAEQQRQDGVVNWLEVSNTLKYSKVKKSPMECLVRCSHIVCAGFFNPGAGTCLTYLTD
jgi:hypothetical protein